MFELAECRSLYRMYTHHRSCVSGSFRIGAHCVKSIVTMLNGRQTADKNFNGIPHSLGHFSELHWYLYIFVLEISFHRSDMSWALWHLKSHATEMWMLLLIFSFSYTSQFTHLRILKLLNYHDMYKIATWYFHYFSCKNDGNFVKIGIMSSCMLYKMDPKPLCGNSCDVWYCLLGLINILMSPNIT